MKKLYGTLCIFLLGALFVCTSCSNEEPFVAENAVEGVIPQVDSSVLIHQLDSINVFLSSQASLTRASGSGDLTNSEKTRIILEDAKGAFKGGKKGRNIGTLLGHPFIGAGAGAVVYGGYKSWRAYEKIRRFKEEAKKLDTRASGQDSTFYKIIAISEAILTDSCTVNIAALNPIPNPEQKKCAIDDTILDMVNLSSEEINVGKMHNLVLSYLDGKLSIDSTKVASSCSNPHVAAVLYSQEFKDGCSYLISHDNDQEPFTDLPGRVMERFELITEECGSSCYGMVTIINKYVQAIEASDELSDEQKDCLKLGFATALYSFNYWDIKLKE